MAKKTKEERAELRRHVESARDLGKDRKAHDDSRGKQRNKPLKVDLDNDQYDASIRELHAGSDRVAAILGSAIVETELRTLLESALKDKSNLDGLLDRAGAPLSTFSSRITVGRAFGVFDTALANEMDIIRSIRNDFAHSLMSIDFDYPHIAAKCEKLPLRRDLTSEQLPLPPREVSSNRIKFEAACWSTAVSLLKVSVKISNDEIKRLKRKKGLDQLMSAGTKQGWKDYHSEVIERYLEKFEADRK